MKAISATTSLGEATVGAIAAGCDAVLFCNNSIEEQVAALETLIHAVESRQISIKRIEDAMARQHRVKARYLAESRIRPALDVVGCAEHQAVAEEMAAWS